MKSTWSQGPISQSQASLSHELWKVPPGPRSTTAPSRPPPGLTNNKPSSTWGGNSLGLAQGWSGSYSSGERSALNFYQKHVMELTWVYLRHKLMQSPEFPTYLQLKLHLKHNIRRKKNKMHEWCIIQFYTLETLFSVLTLLSLRFHLEVFITWIRYP